MSEPKHTELPWDFEGAEYCCRIVSYIDPKREEIAVRLNEADAAFIVESVNMRPLYERLAEAVTHCLEEKPAVWHDGTPWDECFENCRRCALEKALAEIEKAKESL